jgi:hypothetical protein
MFDLATVQTIIDKLLTDLGFMIFLCLGGALAILAALIGLGIGIHYLVKYVARGGAKEIGVNPDDWWGDNVNWEGKNPLEGFGFKEDLAKRRHDAYLEETFSKYPYK